MLSRILIPFIILTSSCTGLEPQPSQADYGGWGVETQHLSATIAPGDNFYRYVNEGWLNATEMPAGYSFYSEPWVVQDQALEHVHELINAAVENPSTNLSPEKRIGDLYTSFMDIETVDQRGLSPIQADLDAILDLQTYEDIAQWMANPRSNSLFHLLVQPPVDMQGGYVLTVAQYRVTGLGLPGQVYYESTEPTYQQHRETYTQYIADVLMLSGINNAEQRARDILDLETQYASIMWDFAQLREAGAAFNLIPRADLDQYAPGFPWQAYLEARGISDIESINIGVGALQESAALFQQIPVEAWTSFLAFHWINNHNSLLPESFGNAAFAFFDTGLWGVDEQAPRQDRAIEFVQRYLGDDIGQLYADIYFPVSHREALEEMVTYIRRAFRERLVDTEWMDEPTRQEALAKLDAIIVEIGVPLAGIDWSDLETAPDDLIGNYARLQDYRWVAQRARIGQPITRYGDWNMHPHRIGMGYHQQYNKIFATAGALLPPFFDPEADPAVNFGAVGQTMAHEFGHALDDQGSKFDRNGALRDWWSEASRTAFEVRTNGLIAQFKTYSTLPDVYLAADQMIGEIVGDLTGASIAYRAYEMYIDDHYAQDPPVIDGFTGHQRFFLSAAQQSRTLATEDALRNMALHWTHPPAEFRINGIFRNLDEWYTDFDITPESALYLDEDDRIRLW